MLLVACGLPSVAAVFPAPFTRRLRLAEPQLQGNDVIILQQLLRRAASPCQLDCRCGCTGVYDAPTAKALSCYVGRAGGELDEAAARKVLDGLSSDGYTDNGAPAGATGHHYKVLIPVHRNRSIETMASVLDANNTKLLSFRVRAHGHDVAASGAPLPGRQWPDFHDDGCPDGAASQGCIGLNMFSSDGMTPTGLSEIDLNTPESEPDVYGPYPVNRFVRGISGNAAFLLSPVCQGSNGPACACTGDSTAGIAAGPPGAAGARPIRTGILMHTGAWGKYAPWTPGQPMPNSDGCVHAYPEAIRQIWQLLTARGVQVRPNTNGTLPYPYGPQGLASVYEVSG